VGRGEFFQLLTLANLDVINIIQAQIAFVNGDALIYQSNITTFYAPKFITCTK
jgi:hypothetical protein